MLTGTDEHGQKIEEKAKAFGKTPKEYVDMVSDEIKAVWKCVNVDYDKFIRTTDSYHEEQVRKIFRKFYEQGDIYKGAYEGWYCTPCESFWTDSQLVGGKCPDCGREVKKAKEEAYFFKMSKYAPRAYRLYKRSSRFYLSRFPQKRNDEQFPYSRGLQDLCVSRTSFKWGIPVTFDDEARYLCLD